MLLLLAPSAAQQQALTAELANLQNPSSPSYHQWLTPAAFAASYANSASDVAQVSAWLQSAGFKVAPLPAGLGWIEFSGTVAQVEQTFQTQIHTVTTATGPRPVLAGTISVPAALIPLVQGLVSLDGALATPALTTPQPVSFSVAQLAAQTAPGTAEALTPRLAAQLLHIDALQSAGVNGAGQTIAIASRSNVVSSDIDAFRTAFALPTMPLSMIPAGPDPGLAADQAEATLAASWAGAAAPGAQIVLVPAATTSATDGLDLSLAAIVDQTLAHTIAVGYSACEAGLSTAHQVFYSALYRQAAAEGIAVIAATGDSGASACYLAGSDTPVSSGYGVNALASTPWNTAVGVAAFGPAGPAAGSASLAAWSPSSAGEPAYASGGGSSTLHPLPGWQPVPAQFASVTSAAGTHNRLLPDVVLPTAIDTGVNPGLAYCLSGSASSGGCTLVRSGGSSAATAMFAGIAALVAQKNGTQGNLAPGLYALSGKSGVFTDVQQGSTLLNCVAGSPGCSATGQIGFSAGAGYDLATGLGVPDAQALVADWASPEASGTSAVLVSITTSPATINPSTLVTINAQVISQTGGATPTGTVLFYNSTTSANLSSTPSPVQANGTASLSIEGGFATGNNQIEAVYSGDSTYESATSQPVDFYAQASSTTIAVQPSNYSPAVGVASPVTATLTLNNPGNTQPTGLVTLSLDGVAVGSTSVSGTTAVFSVTVPSAGTHTLQAVYAGDTNYSGSTSPQVTISASKSTTNATVIPATTTPGVGSALKVTANLTASSYGTAFPTGTFTFTLDGNADGVQNVVSGSTSTASTTVTIPTSGPHNLQVLYSGDANYASSISPIVTVNAGQAASVTTLTATPATLTANTTETLTATLAPATPVAGATNTFTGTISFYDEGTTLLGQATVVDNGATISSVPLKTGVAHSVTAVYSGDGNWLGSTSTALSLTGTNTAPVTVALTSNYSSAQPGAALVLTAIVSPTVAPGSTGEANPTGSVTFYQGTTVIGTSTLSAVANSDTSKATLTTQALPSGQDQISAVYQGDLYYSPGTSNSLVLTVQDFTITPSSTNPATNLNINQGASGSAAYVITGLGGFNGEVQVICVVPTQDDMTCTATPQQVVPTGTVTFAVKTFAATTAVNHGDPRPLWPRAAGGTALAVLAFFLLPFGHRARRLFLKPAGTVTQRLLILALLLVGLVGTNIGCTSNNTLTSTGTPLGVATLQITASAYVDNTVVSHSAYLTVDVLAPGVTAP
jgi:subtilase family serine protease